MVGHLVLSACAETAGTYTLPPPPSEGLRRELGTIGVAAVRFEPHYKLDTPAKGPLEGAGRGAGLGAVTPFVIGVQFPPYGSIAGAALAPGGAVIGGVAGADAARPAKEVEAAEAALTKALAEQNLPAGIRAAVLAVAGERTRRSFVPLPERQLAAGDTEPDYRDLAGTGVDTVLELSVRDVGLAGPWAPNPKLYAVMTVQTRLVRVADGKEVYRHELAYVGALHRFTEWAANEEQLLRGELDVAYRVLAEAIVDEVFLLYLPETAAMAYRGEPGAVLLANGDAAGVKS